MSVGDRRVLQSLIKLMAADAEKVRKRMVVALFCAAWLVFHTCEFNCIATRLHIVTSPDRSA